MADNADKLTPKTVSKMTDAELCERIIHDLLKWVRGVEHDPSNLGPTDCWVSKNENGVKFETYPFDPLSPDGLAVMMAKAIEQGYSIHIGFSQYEKSWWAFVKHNTSEKSGPKSCLGDSYAGPARAFAEAWLQAEFEARDWMLCDELLKSISLEPPHDD